VTTDADGFAAHEGTDFLVKAADGTELVLRLVKVRSLEHQANAPRPNPFALEFEGPARPALDQGIHRLEHAQLGSLDIFLVPIGVDEYGGLLYEAVFS
jgi:hypothetical protein